MGKKSVPMEAAFMNIDDEVFITDKGLVNYLKKKGFVYRHNDSPRKYYTGNKKIQARLDFEEGEITFLNSTGHPIYRDNHITKGDLDQLIKEGAF